MQARLPFKLALLPLTIQLSSCWSPEARTNEGDVCLEAPTADAEGTIYVQLSECLSSSCDIDQAGSCTAELDGSTIQVTSAFSWETSTGLGPCADDCDMIIASCTVGPVAAGSYTVTLGDEDESVSVPTTDECEKY